VDLSEEDGALAHYAQRTGITATNAAVRGHRARKALARGLRATCGTCAGAGCLDCTCRPQPEFNGHAER
jgi:RNA polymerase sigma-70 factor (ECF subfamily)